ncbi:MAG: tetratricopeptide repeat protein [Acidimicrobiales bacterium]
MVGLPTGTVTMMFSDIEGSTTLLHRLGEQYAAALFSQRALMRAAIVANDGVEMGTEGDSFFVVFQSAIGAVRCCVEAQRSLSTHDWPEGDNVRVRMGLHSGEPVGYEDQRQYIGVDVHRAARIAATAHGGQVVLSEATRHLVEFQLPGEVSVKDLGFHRLKDLEELEHIYQLLAHGLEEQFPPLKSMGAETNLPTRLTPLVGRSGEVEQLCATARAPDVRLVTLTGPGGVGKTRLALAAATSLGHAFRDGVYFVSLSGVQDEEAMWSTIADTVNISSEGSQENAVTAHLADRQALLVLDNLEQIHAAPTVVTTLLDAGAHLVVIATSRGPLHLLDEHEHGVLPLEFPTGVDLDAVEACSAVRLFVQQARLIRPAFTLNASNAADIAGICRSLDGLPLAIELAAARVRLLTPKALLARLASSLELSAGDVGRPSRQQTVRATIEWSYQLLTPRTAQILRRLGVFAGGCDLEAFAAVAIQDSVVDPLKVAQDLLDVSLITIGEGVEGDPRIDLLETIRQYSLECLGAAGEFEETRLRHALHYADVAKIADAQVRGAGSLAAFDRLEAEHDNMRAALDWSLSHEDGIDTGLRLVEALAYFWYRHGYATEGRRWLLRALELTPDQSKPRLGIITHWLGVLTQQQGDIENSLVYLERSLSIARELGDRDQQARELNSLGITYDAVGDLDRARSLLEESAEIARSMGDNYRLAAALTNLGHVESYSGNHDRSLQILEEALKLDQEAEDMLGVALDRQSLAATNLRAGNIQRADELLSSMFDYLARSGDVQFYLTTLEISACISTELGDAIRAARLFSAAEDLRLKASMPNDERSQTEIEGYIIRARTAVSSEAWEAALSAGRDLSNEEMITLLRMNSEGHPPASSG